MEPENDGFQKESPFPRADFQIPYYISGVAMLSKGKLLVTKKVPYVHVLCLKMTDKTSAMP